MGTRAVYTFIDHNFNKMFHVYSHWDNYPSGALIQILNAKNLAWKWPRWEASDFSAAFVAANKTENGGIRLTNGWWDHGDLEYRYEIFTDPPINEFHEPLKNEKILKIRVFDVNFNEGEKLIFQGSIKEFEEFIKKYGEDQITEVEE